MKNTRNSIFNGFFILICLISSQAYANISVTEKNEVIEDILKDQPQKKKKLNDEQAKEKLIRETLELLHKTAPRKK